MLVGIIVGAILLISLLLCLVYTLVKKKYIGFVQKNSKKLKELCEVNRLFNFYTKENMDQHFTYDNEIFYDSISCRDYLTYVLQFKQRDVFDQIKRMNYNKRVYPIYLSKVEGTTDYGQFENPIGKLNNKRLLMIEKELSPKMIYKKPEMDFFIRIFLSCSKINGEIYRRKNQTFYVDEIKEICKMLNERNGAFYKNRSIWDSICRVERGKVSNKMRFAIYKRDGYRCRYCGASNKFAELEVDHIKPIAKGGKSTYDNLQTLCHRCNVKKGDSY